MTCRPFAVDPGASERSTCGWAYFDGERLHSGIWNLVQAGPTLDAKLVWFSRRIRFALQDLKPLPTIMAIEQPGIMQGNHTSVEVLHSLVGIYRLWTMAELERPARLIHPATLKKAATGNGRASKGEIKRAVLDRHPFLELKDDNQADAIAMVDMILDEIKGAPPTPMEAAMSRAIKLPHDKVARGRRA